MVRTSSLISASCCGESDVMHARQAGLSQQGGSATRRTVPPKGLRELLFSWMRSWATHSQTPGNVPKNLGVMPRSWRQLRACEMCLCAT